MFRSNVLIPLIHESIGISLKRCSSTASRQSHILKKLMSGKKRPEWKWNNSMGIAKPKELFESKKSPTKITSRRVVVLNKMFMRHVSELIANSESGNELVGLGLEITGVNVCQRYHGLNISWTATGTDDLDYVEQKLAMISRRLRHELSQMQLMGNIPHIRFVRDRELSYFTELDALIAKADYGPDHMQSNTSESDLEKDFQPESEPSGDLKGINSTLPAMRNDVFGLDRSLIIGRIKQHMSKSKQAWKAYEENKLNAENHQMPARSQPFTLNVSFDTIRQEAQNEKQSNEILREFLQKRKLALKVRKTKDNPAFNSQELDEEKLNSQRDDDDYEEDNDWIEDHEEQRFYDDKELQ